MSTVPKTFNGWQCRTVSNGLLELTVTLDVGPRIVECRRVGGPNILRENPAVAGLTRGAEWRDHGGHRLWHAPEVPPRSIMPDNDPVKVVEDGDTLWFVQPTEAATGVQKAIGVQLVQGVPLARVTHRLTNHNLWSIELAPWALTVMPPGGQAIVPLPPRGTHPEMLLPTSHIVLWAYSDLADPRWSFGREAVLLHQDPSAVTPQKLGFSVPDRWVAHVGAGELLVKRFPLDAAATYPDNGCHVELFTNDAILEVETMGPLAQLRPGASVDHVEEWLLGEAGANVANASSLATALLPRIRALLELN